MASFRKFNKISALAKLLSNPDFGRDAKQASLNPKYRKLLNNINLANFEVLLNALIQNPSVNYIAREEILKVAAKLELPRHPVIEKFMYDVLEKDSFGVGLRDIDRMVGLVRQNITPLADAPIMNHVLAPLIAHYNPEEIASARQASFLDMCRNSDLPDIRSSLTASKNLYEKPTIVDYESCANAVSTALKKAKVPDNKIEYLMLFLNQLHLLQPVLYIPYFIEAPSNKLFFKYSFDGDEPTASPVQSRIRITSQKNSNVILEIFYESREDKNNFHGKHTIEIKDVVPNTPGFQNILLSLKEFVWVIPEPFKREATAQLLNQFSCSANIDNLTVKEKILDQLLLPYSKIKNGQVSIDVKAISDINLLFLLYLKRPKLLTDEQRQTLKDKIVEPYFNWVLHSGVVLSECSKELVNYYIEHGKRNKQIQGRQHPTEGLATKVVNRNLPSTHLRAIYRRDGEYDAVDTLFKTLFNSPDEIDPKSLEDFFLPLTRIKNGKPAYTIPPLKAFPNDPKALILALYGIADRANRGDEQAKIYMRKHLRVEDGDYTNPEDLIFAMLRKGLIDLWQCYSFASVTNNDSRKTEWKNKVTGFAVSHKNYRDLNGYLQYIAKNTENKELDPIRTHLKEISEPEPGPLILNTIKDLFARVTSIFYETERYKKYHQRVNANHLLSQIKKNAEPAAAPVAVPPRAPDSSVTIVGKLSAEGEAAVADIVVSPKVGAAVAAVPVPHFSLASTSPGTTVLKDAEGAEDEHEVDRKSPATTGSDPD